jgi:hypothetical protein
MKTLMLKMVDSGSYSNKERALAESRVFPNISSIKEAIHFCQMVHSGTFQEFDYGEKNMEHYGQSEPKEIFLSKIKKMPIAMYVG